MASVGVLSMLWQWSLYITVLTAILMFTFEAGLIVGMRVFPRIVLDLMGWSRRKHARINLRRLVVYGAGYKSTLLLRDMTFMQLSDQPVFNLTGLIDDDPNTWNRIIHGYKVLGGVEYVCREMEQGHIDEILIACNIKNDALQRVVNVATQANVRVDRWSCVTHSIV